MTTREEIARIIAPGAWNFDYAPIRDAARPIWEKKVDRMKTESLTKADAILALSPPEPTEGQINAAAEVIWNDRDARMGGPWKHVPTVCAVQTRATARAALIAARAMSLQDHGNEVLCACTNSCAKDDENKRLREALEPFSQMKMARPEDPGTIALLGIRGDRSITNGDIMRARALLAEDAISEGK